MSMELSIEDRYRLVVEILNFLADDHDNAKPVSDLREHFSHIDWYSLRDVIYSLTASGMLIRAGKGPGVRYLTTRAGLIHMKNLQQLLPN